MASYYNFQLIPKAEAARQMSTEDYPLVSWAPLEFAATTLANYAITGFRLVSTIPDARAFRK